ncbi:hypothetical protein [Hymenobacter sp. YC55]|uniref:hypothetical protein n=1 Tax=Hymenobacter sp. YC55 TaxID=3034019 RepID=UPI0023F76C95|nr:hypothetical protein [Hymenobacter sp. YC55]MDF7815700.1 hypothetical protein [Hymenobacter sp. YC55]
MQDWLVTDWNLRAFRAGIREVSVVQAENVLGALATQQYSRNTAARRNEYEIYSVYYPSLQAAKQGARQALRPQPPRKGMAPRLFRLLAFLLAL